MGFSLNIPQVGLPDTTEDVKVANNFTTLSTWGNGNISDTDLLSPNNGTYKHLLTSVGTFSGGITAGDYCFGINGGPCASGGVTGPIPLWFSGATNRWAVANKTAQGVVRMSVVTNSVAPAVNLTGWLYHNTAVSGTGNLNFTFAQVAGSSTTTLTTPSAANGFGVESSPFTLPTIASSNYSVGVNLSGTVATNAVFYVTCQLFVLNS